MTLETAAVYLLIVFTDKEREPIAIIKANLQQS